MSLAETLPFILHESLFDRRRRTPQRTSIEPFWISSHHSVVELSCRRGLFGDFLKIKDVLPSLLQDPPAVVVILHVLMAGDEIRGFSDSIFSTAAIDCWRFC